MKKVKSLAVLHILLFVYSLGTVCSKKASSFNFLSRGFILFYVLLIIILGLYAIFWQQIIKKLPLSLAYANKAITVIWGMFWGWFIFSEKITIGKIAGAGVIMLGIVMFNYSEEKNI